MADTLQTDDTASPAQVAAANPGGVPQAVSTPGGEPFDLTAAAGDDPRAKKALTDTRQLYAKQIGLMGASEREQEQRDSRYRTRMEQMVNAEGASIADFKPWNAQAELAEHKTDLWSQFGSPGFIVSMLASAFTAQPMNSALQSGAAAMDAINQGDMHAYDKAFQTWKENTDVAIKRLDQEHKEYEDIDHLRTSNLAEWHSKMTALLAKFGDERKMALLNNGYYPDLISAQDAEWTSRGHIATAQQAIIQNKALVDDLNGHPAQAGEDATHKDAKGNPMAGGDARWYQGKDPMGAYADALKKIKEAEYPYRTAAGGAPTKEKEIAKIEAEIRAKDPKISEADAYAQAAKKVEESHRTLTANERNKEESHVGQYDMVLTDVLPQAEDILRKHVGAAGAAGYATRIGESVSNVFGGDETDRRQFESDIEQLRLMAPNLLLDRSTGRPLSAEHALIDKIIRGLNLGDTTANTLRSLDELKRRLGVLRDGAQKRLSEPGDDGVPASPTAPVAAPAGAGWDDFPEVK